ncbi:hypothetical protein [Pelagibius sp. Alg239-R121]|uniref:hypothetical protein n=1 Tax=Pelagibius sp. Alg239-R121 TaxID=2993448 RepID=UPI0024A6C268|nr:hypothetical protein [Pelagibius sp. Alg239-R121]
MKKALSLLALLVLAACDQTLDTKNAGTFLDSFEEITTEMSEAERVEFAASILMVYEDRDKEGQARKRRLDRARKDAAVLFEENRQGLLVIHRNKIASDIVLKVGADLSGKSVAEVNEMAEAVYAAATVRYKDERRKKLAKMIEDYSQRLAAAEQQLTEAEAAVAAEQKRQEDARAFLAMVHVKDVSFAIKKESNGKLRAYLSSAGKLVNGSDQQIQEVRGKVIFKDSSAD